MRNLRLLFLVGLATGFISETLFVSSQTTFSTDDLYLEGRTSGDVPIDDEDGDDDGSGSGSGDYNSSNFTDQEEMLRKFLNFSQTTQTVPAQPQPTADSSFNTSTTVAASQDPTTRAKDTEATKFISPNGNSSEEEVSSPTADWSTQSPSSSPSSTNIPPSETNTTKISIDITVIQDEDNSLDQWDVSTPKNNGDIIEFEEFDNDLRAANGRGGSRHGGPEEVASENMWERTEVLAAVIACGVVGFLCAVFLLVLLAYRMKKKDEGSYDLGDTKVSTTAYHKAPTKEFYA